MSTPMVYSLNLQPHPHKASIHKSSRKNKSLSSTKNSDSKASSKSISLQQTLENSSQIQLSGSENIEDVGIVDQIPTTKFIYPIQPKNNRPSNIELLERLSRFFQQPAQKAGRIKQRWTRRTIPSSGIGCALDKRGQLLFYGPGLTGLPSGAKWLLDPEQTNPLDQVHTNLNNEVDIVCLTGHQLALIQDEYLKLWPLTKGTWLIVSPAKLVSLVFDPAQVCAPVSSFGEPHGYSSFVRRTSDNTTCATMLSIPNNTVAVIRDSRGVAALSTGLKVLTKPDQHLLRFVSLTLQRSTLPFVIQLSNNCSLQFELFLEWRVSDLEDLIANCISANTNKLFTAVLTKLILNEIVHQADIWLVACEANRLHHIETKEMIQQLHDSIETEFSHWLLQMGITCQSMTWSTLRPIMVSRV